MKQALTTDVDYYSHPVFDELRLHLNTPAIVKLEEEMHQWLWTGATGALIYGKPRTGKSTAVKHLAKLLYTRGNINVPVYYVSIRKSDKPSIAAIFRLLCLRMNLRVTDRDRADILSDRFIHYLVDEAEKANCKQAVLIVDEMQRMNLNQFDPFAELYDELLDYHIRLMVIFVANDPQCWSLVKDIEGPEFSHIHGRFFTQGVPFTGITSKAQVIACLKQYDTLRYPLDGPTYTEFFLPEVVKAGWKFASLSEDIWRVYSGYKRDYKIPSWGMKYFTITINTLLTDYLPNTDIYNIDDDVIHECINLSRLIPSLVSPIE